MAMSKWLTVSLLCTWGAAFADDAGVSMDAIRAANPGAPETTIERLWTIEQNKAAARAAAAPPPAKVKGPIGQIRICRDPAITGMLDNKPVNILAGATYTSPPTETDMKSHVQVRVDDAVTLPPGKKNCATVPATLVESDHELKIGERMVQQYSIAGFDAHVTVVKAFR